jgi:DNA-binding response OmpR family regulator
MQLIVREIMDRTPLILAVDDDIAILRLLERILSLEGYRVIITPDGDNAVPLYLKHRPDLAILDIMMPGTDGFAVLDQLRQHTDIPIIMLTAKGEVASLHHALTTGADDYIRKPFHTKELVARIKAKLRRSYRPEPASDVAEIIA